MILFFVVSMGVMLVYSKNKVIVVAHVPQDQIVSQEVEIQQVAEDKFLHFKEGEERTNCLCIPLEEGIKAELVTIENHYMDKELWVYINKSKESFYELEAVYGNIEKVKAGRYDSVKDGVLLKFELVDIYEYRSIMEKNCLYVEFVSPREIYDKIIVIDPMYGAEETGYIGNELEEKALNLDIAKRLKAKLDNTDIKVYYTRMEDVNPSKEDRIEIANAVRADMFIGIGANMETENEKKYGTEAVYSDSFFIPQFGSVELADLVEREVVTSISGKGNGLIAATEDDTVIWEATVPATIIKVGYISNKQEAILLKRDDYRERIATGIYNAIMKAYE